jgi:drug/metabolite transporter (DMT)-like permease
MIRSFPFLFVILWSSAFITGKIIVQDATPFAALGFRFALVGFGFFCFALVFKDSLIAQSKDILEACGTGVLFHGLYLGGVFFAVSKGLPASIAALIVSLQPVLTGALAGPVLGEFVDWRQWVGIMLGFGGAALVLGLDVGGVLPVIGLVATGVALLAVTAGTLWQKRLSDRLPLSVLNMYQAIAACAFHVLVMLVIERPFLEFTESFILAMGWQILAISFGAFSILMYLIKMGSASQTATLFFLVPPVSAVMGWLFLNENLTTIDVTGLLMATLGVYVATRPQPEK